MEDTLAGSAKQPMGASKNLHKSELKGGGFRGGPKRWTGNGPRPARHIPWPEIFKHHISVVEGHLKMIDMVKKHTVPESGNWKTISAMVERTQELLRMSKDVSRSFVPPPNYREQVPIGSSSASMYPGYSPADHQYGRAAEEFGKQWHAMKKDGIAFNPAPDGPEYKVGQGSLQKKTLAQIRAAKAARGEGSGGGSGEGSGSGSDSGVPAPKSNGTTNGSHPTPLESSGMKGGDNPYFVIDTNPTPVNIPGLPHMLKRTEAALESLDEPSKNHSKKMKTNHDSDVIPVLHERIELEDISDEVDARMKAKEEKRKRKLEKKRKRDSGGSAVLPADGEAVVEVDKPKKKKTKKAQEDLTNNEAPSKKQSGSIDEGVGDREGKKKKRKLKEK